MIRLTNRTTQISYLSLIISFITLILLLYVIFLNPAIFQGSSETVGIEGKPGVAGIEGKPGPAGVQGVEGNY